MNTIMTPRQLRLSSRSDRGEPSGSEREAFLIDHGLQTATLLRLCRSQPAELRLFRRLRSEGLNQLQRGDDNLPVRL